MAFLRLFGATGPPGRRPARLSRSQRCAAAGVARRRGKSCGRPAQGGAVRPPTIRAAPATILIQSSYFLPSRRRAFERSRPLQAVAPIGGAARKENRAMNGIAREVARALPLSEAPSPEVREIGRAHV